MENEIIPTHHLTHIMIDSTVKRVLIVGRTFANKPGGGLQKVEDCRPLIEACRLLNVESGVQVDLRLVIPSATEYKNHDKGDTFQFLSDAYSDTPGVQIRRTQMDPVSGCLNEASRDAEQAGYSHVLFISPSAAGYLKPENFAAMISACSKGALVVGLSLEEVPGEVMDNSLAMWNLKALKAALGFDASSAPVKDGEARTTVDVEGEQVPVWGVEEVRPLLRLGRLLAGKRFFAYFTPPAGGHRKLSTDPERMEQDRLKNLSKAKRREAMALMELEGLERLEDFRMTAADLAA